jgi:hypothetical protein
VGRGATRVVFDERFGLGDLIHDQKALGTLDDSLEIVRLVAGTDREAIVLCADALILRERQFDPSLAADVAAALTKELEQAVRLPSRGASVVLVDALVHLTDESLVLRSLGKSRVHGASQKSLTFFVRYETGLRRRLELYCRRRLRAAAT